MAHNHMADDFLSYYRHLNKKCRVKLVFWSLTFPLSEIMRSCKHAPHVSRMLTLVRYNIIKIVCQFYLKNYITNEDRMFGSHNNIYQYEMDL